MDNRTRADMGNVKTSTLNIAKRILNHLDSIGRPLPPHPDKGYPVMWGIGSSSEHVTGRALDCMVTADTSIGDDIVKYVWDHRVEFGVIHIIWEMTIQSTRVAPGEIRPMDDRGTPTENHMDHPHLYFDGRAVAAPKGTPQATPRDMTAPPFPLPRGAYFGPKTRPRSSVSGYYSHRADLRRWQQQMRTGRAAPGEVAWSIDVDGLYGPNTAKVVRQFQAEKGLVVDGLIGAKTWRAAWTEKVT